MGIHLHCVQCRHQNAASRWCAPPSPQVAILFWYWLCSLCQTTVSPFPSSLSLNAIGILFWSPEYPQSKSRSPLLCQRRNDQRHYQWRWRCPSGWEFHRSERWSWSMGQQRQGACCVRPPFEAAREAWLKLNRLGCGQGWYCTFGLWKPSEIHPSTHHRPLRRSLTLLSICKRHMSRHSQRRRLPTSGMGLPPLARRSFITTRKSRCCTWQT